MKNVSFKYPPLMPVFDRKKEINPTGRFVPCWDLRFVMEA